MLYGYYRDFLEPLLDAGFGNPRMKWYDRRLAESPWLVLENVPLGFWTSRENRVRAVRWLVKVSGRRPEELTIHDFNRFGLATLPAGYHRGSPLGALREAGFDIEPWRMVKAPQRYWSNRANRVRAIRYVVEACGRGPSAVTHEDFHRRGLASVCEGYPSILDALKDAGFRISAMDRHQAPPGYWKEKKNRVSHVRTLLKSLGKDASAIRARDFFRAGLGGLLDHYGNSVRLALAEAAVPPPKREPGPRHPRQ